MSHYVGRNMKSRMHVRMNRARDSWQKALLTVLCVFLAIRSIWKEWSSCLKWFLEFPISRVGIEKKHCIVSHYFMRLWIIYYQHRYFRNLFSICGGVQSKKTLTWRIVCKSIHSKICIFLKYMLVRCSQIVNLRKKFALENVWRRRREQHQIKKR